MQQRQRISRLPFTRALPLLEYPHLLWDYIWVISGLKLVTHEDAHPNSFLDNKWNGVDGVPTSPQSQLSAAAAPYPLMLAAARHADETH